MRAAARVVGEGESAGSWAVGSAETWRHCHEEEGGGALLALLAGATFVLQPAGDTLEREGVYQTLAAGSVCSSSLPATSWR